MSDTLKNGLDHLGVGPNLPFSGPGSDVPEPVLGDRGHVSPATLMGPPFRQCEGTTSGFCSVGTPMMTAV